MIRAYHVISFCCGKLLDRVSWVSEAYPWAGKRGNPTRVSSAYPWHPPFPQQKLIMTTCGFRLPNDPRGSWSDWMRQWELYAFGAATKVETRRSVAKQPHDRQNADGSKEGVVVSRSPFRWSAGTGGGPWIQAGHHGLGICYCQTRPLLISNGRNVVSRGAGRHRFHADRRQDILECLRPRRRKESDNGTTLD